VTTRIFKVNGREFEVEILGSVGPTTTVRVNRNLYEVTTQGSGPAQVSPRGPAVPLPQRAPDPKPRPSPASTDKPEVQVGKGEREVKAPMPGTVLEIRVQQGQRVQSGQGLLVLESMKMENVVPSPAEGTVVRILVKEGQQVGSGEVLLILGE